jgi:lipopolysaccharide export system protein LptA
MSRLVLALTLALAASGAVSPVLAQKAGKNAVLPGATGKEPINIDAGKLEYFDKEQKAVYSGAVVAVQGESRLKTEVLTIFLDRAANQTGETSGTAAGAGSATGAGQVKRMEASGGVTIVQKDQVGTGDRATYDRSENKVYLTGNVTLSQGPNVTKGERLVYDLNSGQAVIEGSRSNNRVKSLFVPGSGPDEGSGRKKKALGGDGKPAAADQ